MACSNDDFDAMVHFLRARAEEERALALASSPVDSVRVDLADMLDLLLGNACERELGEPTRTMCWAASQYEDHPDFKPAWRRPCGGA